MKADRLLEIVALLQNHEKLTTHQLVDHLHVSSRTILRDMDTLSALGIPIVSERGRAGGWKLMDHFRSQLSGMSMTELKALFILPSDKVLKDLGIPTKGRDIRLNMLSSLQGNRKHAVRPYLEKVYIDTGTWKPSKERMEEFNVVQQAVFEEKKLYIVYENAKGEQRERLISPLGLVAKGSAWYVVATVETGDIRNFKLSRIKDSKLVREPIVKPETFSLATYWNESKEQFVQTLPSYEATVLAHDSIIHRLTFTGKFVENIQVGHRDDEWVTVNLCFHDEQEITEYVLGFGGRMKLVTPKHLIGRIVQQASAVIQQYASDKEPTNETKEGL
ncbi:YafY family protein [Halalkalibacterium halodurans]|uniref:BH0411 protein n=1 Tax=Halalkalibacterium halodurans (strain ATCC BAA-125 / DSM 18197 / FERM 7344 / JCM 9153 / C-125) TaxID=272558 RepID=Q9KFR6_HALH5|nr:YafY family protein [Halalkalibacterium halodurans]MED4173571.1 YafY family protein [Halalkalibacterium halodurans]BAB04130.1 BH0411 [Halalkalibacterium halodurans C-125]